jgi:hypothetical protein
MNPMLRKAYDYGSHRAVEDFSKHASYAGFMDRRLLEPLAGGITGAVGGYLTPYSITNGPFWDKDERAIRGAIAGGLGGALGAGLASRYSDDSLLASILAGGLLGDLSGRVASSNYDYF